jgi:OPA family sugar phosphate sensor protein UhpC-like MFS transporter
MTRKVLSVVKAPLKQMLQIDDLQVSHIGTVYLVAYMVGQFFAAALGRKYSSRSILLVGMSVSVLCNVACGLVLPLGAAAFWPITAIMAVQGIAQATGWGHTVGIVASWTRREERGTIMSVWATCYQLGAALAKGLASFLFGALGLLWSFHGTAIALALVILLFWRFGHESPKDKGLEPIVDSELVKDPSRGVIGFYQLVFGMGFIYFGFKFLRYALDSWSALILREHFALSTEVAGYYSTAFDWVGFVGVLASGPISDKFFGSRRTPVIFGMSLGCVVGAVLLWLVGLQSLWFFVALLGFVGFMAMGPDALLSGAGAADVADRQRAALAAGIINGVGSAGPILQEPIIGFLKSRVGLDSVFLLLVAVASLAAIGAGVFYMTARRRRLTI